MPTRFNTNSKSTYDVPPLPSGYENVFGTSDLTIPSCGIEDVDVSLFRLFDKEIVPEVGGKKSEDLKKVPVVFAAGEKWAMLKNGRPLRDRNGSLIIPLITIVRSETKQSLAEDVCGRGINQQTGEIVIRRKLSKSDRQYQALINKIFLKNQQNVAVRTTDTTVPDQITTDRTIGKLTDDKAIADGAYLTPNLMNNVYETIVVPSPQFYTSKYQVTVWTQYVTHANQILEKLFSSFLPQGQSWRLDTPKGYWFVASIDDGSMETETNFDDMTQQERFIKHTFTVSVPSYLFATSSPGAPIPVKRYVSFPIVKFEADTEVYSQGDEEESMYVLGSDDPTLPLDEQQNNRIDQRSIGWRKQKVYPVTQNSTTSLEDPASKTSPRGRKIKEINKTFKGETTYSGMSLGGLEIVLSK